VEPLVVELRRCAQRREQSITDPPEQIHRREHPGGASRRFACPASERVAGCVRARGAWSACGAQR